ncbi:anti-repressor SinI family protein [Peribacillus loiseleuriae]
MKGVTVDEEWVELMRQAKELGLTKEEVLYFLEKKAIEKKKDEPTYHIM